MSDEEHTTPPTGADASPHDSSGSPPPPPPAHDPPAVAAAPQPPPTPPPLPAHSDIADGELSPLDPNYVPAESIGWWILTAVVSGGGLIALLIGILVNWPPGLFLALLSLAWLALTALLIWGARHYPGLAYRHTRYAVSPLGLDIRRGVVWKHQIFVPLSRVQHTDVVQGPLMRRFGLATLVTHTAGTANASVTLEGLSLETAQRVRDYLVRETSHDAV